MDLSPFLSRLLFMGLGLGLTHYWIKFQFGCKHKLTYTFLNYLIYVLMSKINTISLKVEVEVIY